jgi:hypothetical protein
MDSLGSQLTANYAIRARLFYEAVARLGPQRQLGPGFLALLGEIISLQEDCVRAGNELQSYVADLILAGDSGGQAPP